LLFVAISEFHKSLESNCLTIGTFQGSELKESFEIIKRDDGYIDFIETKAYFTTYEEWLSHSKEVLGIQF
jgi:hypothetical protein